VADALTAFAAEPYGAAPADLKPLRGGCNPDDPWCARFTPGRRERLEAGVAVVDVDFAAIGRTEGG
jgi:hypothetical protein